MSFIFGCLLGSLKNKLKGTIEISSLPYLASIIVFELQGYVGWN